MVFSGSGAYPWQLLQLLVRKCQEYEHVSETSEFFWGPSSFPQVGVE